MHQELVVIDIGEAYAILRTHASIVTIDNVTIARLARRVIDGVLLAELQAGYMPLDCVHRQVDEEFNETMRQLFPPDFIETDAVHIHRAATFFASAIYQFFDAYGLIELLTEGSRYIPFCTHELRGTTLSLRNIDYV